ncbi:inactive serine/threonine-protein kinase PLK5-like isoform X6 [Anas platyrhynchos]|uniref:inactive serine/threonine-protein kinase PLK5-like isoform X6 n=1 Tax=Anas platyrhynchos TaxID=8839 RepID=UPI003AF31696
MGGAELPGSYVVDEGSGRLFKLGGLLGEGAFGRCYRLSEVGSGRGYAAKVIPRARLKDPGVAERRDFPAVLGVSPPPQVQREQELQGRLRHRHVLRLHGHLATRSHLYLLLELCGRRSLADILRARGVLTEPEARYYLRQGGEGLSYLHGQGLVHRDLKPTGNVLVTERMQVKIGDLGLARPAAVGTRCWGALCGTPAYMAPEVLDHKGHGVPSDIWAWGCIMYEVLTGSPPFEAAERQELYGRIRTARYPLPPSLSPRARALLGRLLLPDPTARAGLGEVLEHGFFTQGFTPDSLPPHACRTVPVFCLLKGAVVALARRWVNWEHWDAATRPPPRSRFLGRSSAPQPWAEENLY